MSNGIVSVAALISQGWKRFVAMALPCREAGHATTAAIAPASERSIMNQTGHRSVQMVRLYIRGGSLFRENSAGKLGL